MNHRSAGYEPAGISWLPHPATRCGGLATRTPIKNPSPWPRVDKARVRFVARLVLYAGMACFALSVLWTAQVYQGMAEDGTGLKALVAAVLGLMLVTPAGFAVAMAKE